MVTSSIHSQVVSMVSEPSVKLEEPDEKASEDNSSSAMKLFLSHCIETEDGIDASGIISTECYESWLGFKRRLPKKPAEAFRKSITGHLRGDYRLNAFPPEVEAALLAEVRQPRVWACFRHTDLKIGLRGFQSKGYWEQQKLENEKKSEMSSDLVIEPKEESIPDFSFLSD